MLEELQVIADSLAARLQRSVALDDPQLRLLVHTPHQSEVVDQHRVESIMQKVVGPTVVEWVSAHGVSEATEPVRIPPLEERGVIARICVPVRCRGVLLAYLWLLDAEQTVTDAEIEQAVESANAAGEVLFREQLLGDLERGRDRELLRDLLASDDTVRADAARALVAADRLPDGAHAVVLAVRVERDDETGADTAIDLALQRAVNRIAPLRAICGGSSGVLLVAGRQPTPERLRAIGADLHAQMTAAVGDQGAVRVGIGPVVPSIDRAHDSHRCALDAIRVIAQVPGFSQVATWDDLGVYRLLIRLSLDELRDAALPSGLQQLLDVDDGVLLRTLEVYLDHAGRVRATIEALSIHRTSLYYRVNRIEEITGMNLADGGERLSLHLGIKLSRLLGLLPAGL